ncbi:MAG: hypothetical protein M3N39_03660, partial [Pseudomonadota bacterium]|nr:hypothetical protein [Pseudomonadota bacterium]
QLRPITLFAIQKGLTKGTDPQNQSQLDALWRTLLKQPETELPAREVAMQISPFDVQLLLGQLLAAANAEGPGAQVPQGHREPNLATSRRGSQEP